MTRGPQQQRLRDYLDSANQDELRRAARQWQEGQILLESISEQLDRMSGEMATSDDEEFQGRTADAARHSFVTSSRAMADKAAQLMQGAGAFEQSAAALDTAVTERDALAQGDDARPPVRPSTPPGSTDPADVRAQRDYDTANAAYWEKYHADERRAADAITALDRSHTAAGEVFKGIHGEPDPAAPSGGGGAGAGGGAAGGGGVSPTAGGGGRDTDFDPLDTDDDADTHHDADNDTDSDTDNDAADDTPAPSDTDHPVYGEPTGPTGPVGSTTPSTSPSTTPAVGVGPVPTSGPSTPAAGGVAAGLGVGLAGGLAGGVAGGLAYPGTVVSAGGATPGGRGIGAGGPRGAGSPVLGRGNGVAGVGNGAGTGARGNTRGSGRPGAGGSSGRGLGRGGGTRGAAGSRGALGGAGVTYGTGSGRRRDQRRTGEEHELFGDGQDWLDDEDAYDGVID